MLSINVADIELRATIEFSSLKPLAKDGALGNANPKERQLLIVARYMINVLSILNT
ncbi:MAG: hypothetical protein H0W50_09935 [Parachlamydiaceae bacterium]|nr:hypothetical protein [Parachlamydiaceae bacterium]